MLHIRIEEAGDHRVPMKNLVGAPNLVISDEPMRGPNGELVPSITVEVCDGQEFIMRNGSPVPVLDAGGAPFPAALNMEQ